MRPGPSAPVAALDIDGTSGNYHAHFTWFMELWTGKPMPDPKEYTGGVPFHKHLGVSRQTYRDGKLAYRQGGWKRFMPAYDGIGELTKHIRKNGVQVWICTTRPYLRLDNIDPDTRHWLRRVGMQHDAILYGPHKYRDLVQAVGADRVVVVYDDLPEMVRQSTSLGLPTVLRAQPYNVPWHGSGNWSVAHSVDEMRAEFDSLLQQWRKQHG